MILFKKIIPYAIVLFLGLFAIAPLLSAGFFPIHDDTQVTRVYEMAKALNDGMFPVRWSMDLGFGFGYPIFNFYAPLAYYIGGFLVVLGASALDATKTMMIIGILLAGLSMYLFVKEILGKWAGALAATLYMYAPYHAIDIYIRGDVSEAYAYGFIPLLFYGLYKIYKDKNFTAVFIAALSYALIITSHNLTALMITPFAIIFAFFLLLIDKKNTYRLISSFILGISLAAFYWIPAIFEMNYTNVLSQIGGGADFKDHFVCLYQLWASPWGYGGSAKGCIDGVSFMIGKYHILLFVISILLLIYYFLTKKLSKFTKEEKANVSILILFILFTVLSVFLTLSISKPLWELIKPMEFFQFPWRFLIVASFGISVVGSGSLWLVSKSLKRNYYFVLSVVLIFAIVFLNAKFFVPQFINNKTSSDYVNREKITWDISNISSEYMPKDFYKPKFFSETASFGSIEGQGADLLEIAQSTNKIVLLVKSQTNRALTIPLAYFPAWQVMVNGEKSKIIENPKGSLLKIKVGENRITLNFRETPIEKAANLISIASIIALLLGIMYFRKKHE